MTRNFSKSKKRRLRLRSKLALENIKEMLNRAFLEGYRCNIERSIILGRQARRLSKATGVKIPWYFKFFFCKKCKRFLIPGKTMRIRIRNRRESHITITCLLCGSIKRVPLRHR